MLVRLEVESLKKLILDEVPLIDVRAPVEFLEGALPRAVNIPILNNEERAKIGTTYKQQGSETAVALGYKLISGAVKDQRLQDWQNQIQKDPRTVIYCFRGGKRSQITQQWLHEAGIDRPIISGGYKASRQYLTEELEQFSKSRLFLVVSGPTGSGKTEFLRSANEFYPTLDLEGIANHRGSAFGAMGGQPTQIQFEIDLAASVIKLENQYLQASPYLRPLLEDESRLIGSRAQPESMFKSLRSSQVVWIEASVEQRVEQIFKEYILESAIGKATGGELDAAALEVYAKYHQSLLAIEKRLGGLKRKEISDLLQAAQNEHQAQGELGAHRKWIEALLVHYYDPLYLDSLKKREPVVAFKGSREACMEFLRHERSRWGAQ